MEQKTTVSNSSINKGCSFGCASSNSTQGYRTECCSTSLCNKLGIQLPNRSAPISPYSALFSKLLTFILLVIKKYWKKDAFYYNCLNNHKNQKQ